MLRVAFASDNRSHVNQHFGAAERFIIHEVGPDKVTLVGVGEFSPTQMDGDEDKLIARIDFLTGCAAVFIMAIGASAIKQLLAANIQPVRVSEERQISAILADIQASMREGGEPWIDKALAAQKSPERFAAMADEQWLE